MKVSAVRRLIILPILGALILLGSTGVVSADQAAQEDGEAEAADEGQAADEEEQDQQQQQQQQQQDDQQQADDGSSSSSSSSSNFSVCKDSAIIVEDMSILCDSPGTYYYGSSRYRASSSCKPGDKAKIYVDFLVQDAQEIEDSGGDIYVTLLAESFSTPGDQIVYEHAELCGLSTIKSLDGADCGQYGNFRVATQFMWPESSSENGGDDDDSSFYPQLTVGFKSDMSNNAFDLGGANTDLCKGNHFANWKEGVRKSYSGTLGVFIKTFGILVITALLMAAVAWYMVTRTNVVSKTSILPHTKKTTTSNPDKQQVWDDEFKKVRLLAEKDVLDF